MPIQMSEQWQTVSIQYLKLNAQFLLRHWTWQLRHFEYIAEFSFPRIFYFVYQVGLNTCRI